MERPAVVLAVLGGALISFSSALQYSPCGGPPDQGTVMQISLYGCKERSNVCMFVLGDLSKASSGYQATFYVNQPYTNVIYYAKFNHSGSIFKGESILGQGSGCDGNHGLTCPLQPGFPYTFQMEFTMPSGLAGLDAGLRGFMEIGMLSDQNDVIFCRQVQGLFVSANLPTKADIGNLALLPSDGSYPQQQNIGGNQLPSGPGLTMQSDGRNYYMDATSANGAGLNSIMGGI